MLIWTVEMTALHSLQGTKAIHENEKEKKRQYICLICTERSLELVG